jgi:PAS domain S-box-containing protein
MTTKTVPKKPVPKKIPPVLKNMALVVDDLRESEKTYRAVFDLSGIATIIIEEDATISLVNNKFEEISGYGRQEIENKKQWTEFVAAEDLENLTRYLSDCQKNGGWAPANYSFIFVDRKGVRRDVSISVHLIPESGKLVASFVDITPRKKFEKMLRLNEERYRSLVKSINTGVFRLMWKPPVRFVWANPAFLIMTGYGSLGELLRLQAATLFADSDDYDRILEELKTGGFVQYSKIQFRKNDGTVLWVSLTAEVKKNAEGSIEYIDGTVENITDRVQIEQDLKRAYNRYGELLNAVTTYGIIGMEPDGILSVFNNGSERMLGYTAEELLGKATPLLFLHEPELFERARLLTEELGEPVHGFEAFVRKARTLGCDEREWSWVRKDGTVIPVELTLTVMRDEEGRVTGYLGVAQEISDKKRLEEAFRYDKLQMSGVIYNIPEPTFAIDRAGRVIAWNRSIEELSGVKAVDILGKGDYEYAIPFYADRQPMLADLIFASDQEIKDRGYGGLHREANSITAETQSMKMQGKELVIRAIASPIYDDSGEIAGAIQSITDITDLKRRESELQVSEAWFRAILENIGSATMIADEETTILYVNPAFERLTGFTREEVEHKRKWTEYIFPEDLPMIQEYNHNRLTRPEKYPSTCEFRFIRWDGQVRNGYITVTAIPGTTKTVNSILDMTERKQAEDAVQRANKKLNYFNSVTRHDILNLLTSLKGNLEMSKEQVHDPSLLKSVEKELAAADAIQAQIMFTHDYQDIGIQPPKWQDLGATIISSCSGIHLGDIDIAIDITGVEIYADRLLQKVFFHLIDNAIRYGERIKRIRFFCEESFEELLLVCEDDGVGVPPEAKDKIFSRQYFRNAGLDMYLSREILSITGITISETGTYEKGARFEIRVPKGAYRFSGERGHR